MCIIIVKPAGVNWPNDEVLCPCKAANKDGMGLCWYDDEKKTVTIKKGINIDEMIKTFIAIPNRLPSIIHFRLATTGLKDEGNCHPYPVTNNKRFLRSKNIDCDMAVAHNGSIPIKIIDDELNDTQTFVRLVMSDCAIKENIYTNYVIQFLVKQFINSKIAILNNSGDILMLGNFILDKETGLIFSNTGYQKTYKTTHYGVVSYTNQTTPNNSRFEHKNGFWIQKKEIPVRCDDVDVDDVLTEGDIQETKCESCEATAHNVGVTGLKEVQLCKKCIEKCILDKDVKITQHGVTKTCDLCLIRTDKYRTFIMCSNCYKFYFIDKGDETQEITVIPPEKAKPKEKRLEINKCHVCSIVIAGTPQHLLDNKIHCSSCYEKELKKIDDKMEKNNSCKNTNIKCSVCEKEFPPSGFPPQQFDLKTIKCENCLTGKGVK